MTTELTTVSRLSNGSVLAVVRRLHPCLAAWLVIVPTAEAVDMRNGLVAAGQARLALPELRRGAFPFAARTKKRRVKPFGIDNAQGMETVVDASAVFWLKCNGDSA